MAPARRSDAVGIAELLDQVARAAFNLGYGGGLNPAQWAALRYFRRASRAARTPGGFASFQGTTKGTASQTVGALVAKGLLAPASEQRDRRTRLLEVTAAGEEMLRRDPLFQVAAAIEGLAPEQQRDLSEILELLLRALLARRDAGGTVSPPAGSAA
jgi:DNA-binding MarR family transcriptional regulator